MDFIKEDFHTIFPFKFFRDFENILPPCFFNSKYSILTGLLPTTLFYHDDYSFSVPLKIITFDVKDGNKKFYRLDVLVIKTIHKQFDSCIGAGDSEQMLSDEKRFCPPFGNRPFTFGFTFNGSVRHNKKSSLEYKAFGWNNGDVISMEINKEDNEVAFLNRHRIFPITFDISTLSNLIVGVSSSNRGAFFHILYFGPVDSLEFVGLLGKSKIDIRKYNLENGSFSK